MLTNLLPVNYCALVTINQQTSAEILPWVRDYLSFPDEVWSRISFDLQSGTKTADGPRGRWRPVSNALIQMWKRRLSFIWLKVLAAILMKSQSWICYIEKGRAMRAVRAMEPLGPMRLTAPQKDLSSSFLCHPSWISLTASPQGVSPFSLLHIQSLADIDEGISLYLVQLNIYRHLWAWSVEKNTLAVVATTTKKNSYYLRRPVPSTIN